MVRLNRIIRKYGIVIVFIILMGISGIIGILLEWRYNAVRRTSNLMGVSQQGAVVDIPESEYLFICNTEDVAYLNEVIDTIFNEGTDYITEEEMIIEILKYTTSVLELKNNHGNATKILKDGHAICGGISVVYRTLVRKVGIPARIVNIYGIINMGAHSLVEVYYNGKWNLIDPTLGLFFYSENVFNELGKIASLEDLLAHGADGWYLYQVVEKPYVGYYDDKNRLFEVSIANDDYLADRYGVAYIDLYRSYFNSAFPVLYDYEMPPFDLSHPFEADFNTSKIIVVGEVDSNNSDMVQATTLPETFGRVGFYRIGGEKPNSIQSWFVTAPSPGYVRIIYHSDRDSPPVLELFPLRATYLVESTQKDKKADFLLRISEPDASFQLYSTDDSLFWIDAVEAYWLGDGYSK